MLIALIDYLFGRFYGVLRPRNLAAIAYGQNISSQRKLIRLGPYLSARRYERQPTLFFTIAIKHQWY